MKVVSGGGTRFRFGMKDLLIGVVLPVVWTMIVAFLLFVVLDRDNRQHTMQLMDRELKGLDRELAFLERDVERLATDSVLINALVDPRTRKSALPEVIERFALGVNVKAFVLTDPEGVLIFAHRETLADYSEFPNLKEVLTTGKTASHLDLAKEIYVVAAPVYYFQNIFGIVVCGFDFKTIFSNHVADGSDRPHRMVIGQQRYGLGDGVADSWESMPANRHMPFLYRLGVVLETGTEKSYIIDVVLKAAGLVFLLSIVLVTVGLIVVHREFAKVSVYRQTEKPLRENATAERRRIETLEAEMRKFADVLRQSPSMMMIVNPGGEIEYVNESFCATFGYTIGEILGQNILLLDGGLDGDPSERWQTMTAGGNFQGEWRHRKKGGEPFWVSSMVAPIRAGDGKVSHYFLVGDDISLRKEREQRWHGDESRIEALFQILDTGIWERDWQMGEMVFSRHWWQMFGLDAGRQGIDWETWWQRVHPGDRTEVDAQLQRHFSGESDGYRSEHRMCHEDGRWLRVRERGLVCQWSPEGKPVRMVCAVVDISAHEREGLLRGDGVEADHGDGGEKVSPSGALVAHAAQDDETQVSTTLATDSPLLKMSDAPMESAVGVDTIEISETARVDNKLLTGSGSVSHHSGNKPFPSVPGWDSVAGLGNVGGNEALYRNLLLGFCEKNHTLTERMHDMLSKSRYDRIRKEVMDIQGVLLELGALKLHDQAVALEGALRGGKRKRKTVDHYFNPFCQSMDMWMGLLRGWAVAEVQGGNHGEPLKEAID